MQSTKKINEKSIKKLKGATLKIFRALGAIFPVTL
jgi:hypothetical protein